MGLFDKAKSAVGIGDGDNSDADEMAEDWIDEVDSEVQESEEKLGDDPEIEAEPVEEEWESAYKFAEEFLEMRGFASMVDFGNKCMAHKINQSPLYRDRISNGVDTMNRITTMQEQMRQIGGGQKEDESYEAKAQKLASANEVIDQAQKLSGQEDAMVNEALNLGRDLVDAVANGETPMQGGSDVNSDVNRRNERL